MELAAQGRDCTTGNKLLAGKTLRLSCQLVIDRTVHLALVLAPLVIKLIFTGGTREMARVALLTLDGNVLFFIEDWFLASTANIFAELED